ncbi:MAG: hypothetical protein A4E40_00151 [Methanoregulaceae archaeon PtaU1.Bin059]|nr:MAG: hypothetical protein A4E39_01663 [Methanoregulaceae archaeon PtaB.Bin152]OPY43441.1 MAG: hypothetical protein A4E40_00151 [Methanoregulaceae archaeon PtaU1.Bin059]
MKGSLFSRITAGPQVFFLALLFRGALGKKEQAFSAPCALHKRHRHQTCEKMGYTGVLSARSLPALAWRRSIASPERGSAMMRGSIALQG